jgi:hypothetical protein
MSRKMDREKFIKVIKEKFILHIYDSNIVKVVILDNSLFFKYSQI